MLKKHPQILAILGYPLGHSLSPAMQQAALKARGLPWYYIPLEVSPVRLAEALKGLRALENFAGANVTIPHKTSVIPFLDALSPEAQATGAVNTIVVGKGGWKGYNTDIHGFLAPLKRRRFTLAEKNAVILGAGGAARAVLYALLQEGVKTVTILCRKPTKARTIAECPALAGRMAGLKNPKSKIQNPKSIEIYPFDHPRAAEKIAAAHLLVNATPLGMKAGERPPIALAGITRRLLVYDLIYNPPLTLLLKIARSRGARVLNGQEMLLSQGALAFELWTRQSAPRKIMETALKKTLKLF